MKAKARCLDCGTIAYLSRSRCDTCRHRKRNARYGGTWRTYSATKITQHIAQHGLTCGGWHQPPHPVATRSTLTVDHELDTVLCRACNSGKRDRG